MGKTGKPYEICSNKFLMIPQYTDLQYDEQHIEWHRFIVHALKGTQPFLSKMFTYKDILTILYLSNSIWNKIQVFKEGNYIKYVINLCVLNVGMVALLLHL